MTDSTGVGQVGGGAMLELFQYDDMSGIPEKVKQNLISFLLILTQKKVSKFSNNNSLPKICIVTYHCNKMGIGI